MNIVFHSLQQEQRDRNDENKKVGERKKAIISLFFALWMNSDTNKKAKQKKKLPRE